MSLVNELIIIIPVILNLKGNLEMNLSARLGTAANVGDLDDPTTRNSIIFGNLSLLQLQAAVVSFVAANVSFLLAHFMPATPEKQEDPFPDFELPGNGTETNSTAIVSLRIVRDMLRAPPTAHRPHPIAPVAPKFGISECVRFIYCLYSSPNQVTS
jgi:solute carrier family 41